MYAYQQKQQSYCILQILLHCGRHIMTQNLHKGFICQEDKIIFKIALFLILSICMLSNFAVKDQIQGLPFLHPYHQNLQRTEQKKKLRVTCCFFSHTL